MDGDWTGPAWRDESGDLRTDGDGITEPAGYELLAAVSPYERAVLLSEMTEDTEPLWLIVRGNNRLVLGMVEAPSREFADRVVALCADRGLTAAAVHLERRAAETIAGDVGLRAVAGLLDLESV